MKMEFAELATHQNKKMHINWEERAKSLERILEEAKAEAKKKFSIRLYGSNVRER